MTWKTRSDFSLFHSQIQSDLRLLCSISMTWSIRSVFMCGDNINEMMDRKIFISWVLGGGWARMRIRSQIKDWYLLVCRWIFLYYITTFVLLSRVNALSFSSIPSFRRSCNLQRTIRQMLSVQKNPNSNMWDILTKEFHVKSNIHIELHHFIQSLIYHRYFHSALANLSIKW